MHATHAAGPPDAGVELHLARSTRRALAARDVPLALGGIGFLTTFRDGAETALFLSALGQEHAAEALWGGILVALVILLGLS